MSAKRSGLGRGLDALLPRADKGIEHIAIELLQVSPYQPRKRIDPQALAELSQSIVEKGILQPLLLRPLAQGYEIIAGERRFRAAQQAGLSTVPAIIRSFNDQETLEIAIIENLQREDLTALEQAHAYKQLMEFGMSREEIGRAIGKSPSSVSNMTRLLKLEEDAAQALDEGVISIGHAKAILSQPVEDQSWALQVIIEHQLTVRDAETLRRPPKVEKASESREGEKVEERDPTVGAESTAEILASKPMPSWRDRHQDLAFALSRYVGSKVKISGRNKGKLEIHFHSEDELQRLLELLGYQD